MEIIVLVPTSRFGMVEVDPNEILTFPEGIPAFEHLRQFFFYPIPENPAFTWLQAVADPEVAFLLVDPFLFFPGYTVELPASLQEELAIKDPADALVYAVVTIPDGDIRRATANLVGPMIINPTARRGIQYILEGTKYTTRHPLVKEYATSRPAGR
ncbi:Flagellar assembly factor FliW [Moorella thermoacetica]|uniref:Flagellar assembly factor FliW n=1 Tax=Neomoorella thermoacetica TaxID=1525 RepID=A0AAC9MTD5_NEOTH|nr:flagellar assembly protein FliW [Moorella thermoacetica]AOQ23398.1 Flagellar assembly factor FliW [Moorella thermoacetica]TYL09515.1 Flagellar assembly factor FliW [Moorella thermoacetica]